MTCYTDFVRVRVANVRALDLRRLVGRNARTLARVRRVIRPVLCSDNVTSKYGNDYTWTVAKDGKFDISVTPQSGKKYTLHSQITVKNAAGEVVADVSEYSGKATASLDAKAGEHVLRLLEPVADHRHMKVHRRDD